MIAADLIEALEDFDGGNHVVVTVFPGGTLVLNKPGHRFEISGVHRDVHGVVNLIVEVGAGQIDPGLLEENDG